VRVAFVSNVVYPFVTGGAEKRIHEIGTRLADAGHDVTVYGRHFWEGPRETGRDGLTLRAVAPERPLYSGERRSITEAIDFAARALPPLRRQLARDAHDVVVASVFPYVPVLATKLAGLRTDTPLVTTWHEVWGDYWAAYLGRLAPFGTATERLTARLPQHPVAISSLTADRLADIGQPRERIEVVPNGIDIARIDGAPVPADGFDVLFAGRLLDHKNVDILLQAFDEIADEHDATLGIIGDGPDRGRLEAARDTLQHPDRVRFLGFLEAHDDVLGHMRAAEVFASPSAREGFGITYLEAMAADCTVIAARHPDSAADEVVADAGFLVEPSVDALAGQLAAALEGHRPPSAPRARAERYDWETVATQAEATYQRAVAGGWDR
jgi:glycosyltransferase involved in cell wall biosynthesis